MLTHKAPPIINSRRQFQSLPLFQNNKNLMIFHENCLLADDSHEISYFIFVKKIGKMLQNMSCAAVVIDALKVKRPINS